MPSGSAPAADALGCVEVWYQAHVDVVRANNVATNEPIGPDELDGLFGPYHQSLSSPETCRKAALAVSGGSDSTALMVLLAEWCSRSGTPISNFAVLTVDHGLRSESAAEARSVRDQALALGFLHAVLEWKGAKPKTGLQAAARAARYGLMADHMRTHGMSLLFTAHTADDQAETLLMRLARGSGLDGLSAMTAVAPLDAGRLPGHAELSIVRPLLDLPKARLRATLEQRGIQWFEDASNHSPTFERARLRAATPHLEALGLNAGALSTSARRLQRARVAIDAAVAAFCGSEDVLCHPCGFLRIDLQAFRRLPEEIALRVLTRAVVAAGGSDQPIPLTALEAITVSLRSGANSPGTWTVAHAMVAELAASSILLTREPAREPLPRLLLTPGANLIWDGRFWVRSEAGLGTNVHIGPLTERGLQLIHLANATDGEAPAPALLTLPALWDSDALLGVPPLQFWPSGATRGMVSASFLGFDRYNSRGAFRLCSEA